MCVCSRELSRAFTTPQDLNDRTVTSVCLNSIYSKKNTVDTVLFCYYV